MRDKIIQIIHEYAPPRLIQRLEKQVKESLVLRTRPEPDDNIPIGASKIGGLADLPENVMWPSWRGKALSFIAQINLADLPKHNFLDILPPKGMLSFFYSAEQETWGFDPKEEFRCSMDDTSMYLKNTGNLDPSTIPIIRSNLPAQIDWLLQHAGPVVRWRAASELCRDFPASELDRLRGDLLAFPLVQAWLERMSLGELSGELENLNARMLQRLGGMVHGSQRTCLENVLGRLTELGLRAGMPPVDERLLPLRRIFTWQGAWHADAQFQSAWESLVKSVFAWGLLRLGYPPDAAMKDYLYKHIEIVYKIAAEVIYDIYATPEELVGLPKAWAGKPVMKQEIMANYHLPLIHDMYLLAHLPPEMLDEQTAARIDAIVEYVLDPRFQSLHDGYGYAWIKERRTVYGWGWSPHLVGYHGFDFAKEHGAATLVQRLEWMARFPRARRSAWFRESLQHLETFRTDRDTYRFPAGYLLDRPDGYYVSGYGMGLGEDRRGKLSLEIESTFRLLKIKEVAREA